MSSWTTVPAWPRRRSATSPCRPWPRASTRVSPGAGSAFAVATSAGEGNLLVVLAEVLPQRAEHAHQPARDLHLADPELVGDLTLAQLGVEAEVHQSTVTLTELPVRRLQRQGGLDEVVARLHLRQALAQGLRPLTHRDVEGGRLEAPVDLTCGADLVLGQGEVLGQLADRRPTEQLVGQVLAGPGHHGSVLL